MKAKLALLFWLGISLRSSLAAPVEIVPTALWPDDRGQHINAHGGGILRQGDTYYWFGECYPQHRNGSQRLVSCYSSQDLAHWKFRNLVVKADDPAHFGGGWILERPKVFYNAQARQYVMYCHIDDGRYKKASVAVFTSPSVDGDYQFLKYFRPLGHESRDIGQFVDDDGSAYLIFEDRPLGFHIAALSADYLSVDHEVCLIPQHMEGGALVHYRGLYYVIGSGLSGWGPNPNKFATSPSLSGPWSAFRDIAPPATRTYGSQSTLLLKVTGSKTTSVIFLADIWKPSTQWDSRYLWMPVSIGEGNLAVPPPAPWTIDVATGESRIQP